MRRRFVVLLLLAVGPACFVPKGPPDEGRPDAAGCADEVPIVGAPKPAEIVLALDQSGSMKSSVGSDTAWVCCQSASDGMCTGYSHTGDCKWNILESLVAGPGGFLERSQAHARVGLALFPAAPDICAAAAVVAPPARPGANLAELRQDLEAAVPSGGTPSAATLSAIGASEGFSAPEAGVDRLVVLVTDGLPNCNAAISPAECVSCTNGLNPSDLCGGDPRNCLDDQRLVSAVTALRAAGIDTLVVGFGSALVGSAARDVLNRAAEAGGRPLSGQVKYRAAASREDLAAILDGILPVVEPPCWFTLSRPVADASGLVVKVLDAVGTDDVLERGTDWDFTDAGLTSVVVEGAWCRALGEAETGRYVVRLEYVVCPNH